MNSHINGNIIEKIPFEFKSSCIETGLLLSVQHTESFNGCDKRVPFKLFGFSNDSSIFVAISSRKDIYVFDLNDKQYWCLSEAAKNGCCLNFENGNRTSVLIGTKYGSIYTVDLTSGEIKWRLKAFDDRIIDILCIDHSKELFVCYSSKEAVICRHAENKHLAIEQRFFTVTGIKSILDKLPIKKVTLNVSSVLNLTVVVLLSDDSLYIYEDTTMKRENKFASIKLIKHIHPIERRDLYCRHLNNHRTHDSNNNDNSVDIISDIAFNTDGTELWVTSRDSHIAVIETNQWHVIKNVAPETFHIENLALLSTEFTQSLLHKPLKSLYVGISNTRKLVFLTEKMTESTINLEPFMPWKCSTIKRLSCAPDNSILAVILCDGTLKIYLMEFLLRQVFQTLPPQHTPMDNTCLQISHNLNAFDKKIDKVLPRQRLLAILSEYGEYPAQYRQIIWKHLLKLPNNTTAYCKLLEKGPHQCIQSFGRNIRVSNIKLHKSLKRIISMLAHWSQILGISFYSETHFLPNFAFPFVKFSSNNLLVCFEMIATILLNQCHLWFEFSPMLPANCLGLIENLIDHFEPALIQFYRCHSIDSTTFAWKVMRTAFSEILDDFQWFMLWDHILSNPSYFVLFVVVALNCVQRSVIERLKNAKEVNAFFDEPCTVNMRVWLRKAYELMENCPKDLHPNQYMTNFICLGADDLYRKILNYPYDEFQKWTQQKNRMQHRIRSINQRYMELEKSEMDLMQQMVNNIQIEEHRRRMRNVELVHDLSLVDDVENQRQHLTLSERQLNNREVMLNMIQKGHALRNKMHQHEIHLQKSICDLNKMKLQDETELLAAESALRKRDIELLIKECSLPL